MRTVDGNFVASGWAADAKPGDPKPTFQWKEMCISGGYHSLVVAQTEEICRSYPVDGFWYDIYHAQQLCYCENCRPGIASEGIDIDDLGQVEAYRARTIRRHCHELTRLIRSLHPNASIYFNGVTALDRPQNFRYRLFDMNTKNDLEDLPTTWGGYDKFPLRAKIFHRERKPIVAMSGKFHTAWGEFGGFKDPEAMRFEAAAMIANGASCNFGDHLHPSGLMDMTTYENIGHAFKYVEQIESYGIGAVPASSLGFWPSYELSADEGLARMLLEEQIDFDVARPGDDLSRFQTIVVPSKAGVLAGSEKQVEEYLAAGGSLLVLGAGILNQARIEPAIPCGARFVGAPNYDVDYTVVGQDLRAEDAPLGVPVSQTTVALRRPVRLPASPFLNYDAALRFSLDHKAIVLAAIQEPYFSRTYGAYCGHQNTPNRPENSEHPAAWRSANMIVLAHNLDRMYYRHGAKVHRDLFARALRKLHHDPMIEATLPSAGRVTLLYQSDRRRYIAHLLYGPPIERGRCLVIEDLPRMYGVPLRFRLPRKVKSLRLIPGEVELPIERIMDPEKEFSTPDAAGKAGRRNRSSIWGGEVIATSVPEFAAHCCVVVEVE